MLLLALALPLLLGQCDNSASQPPLSQIDAIKLAKAAAAQLQSPPHRYYGDNRDEVANWPDKPDSVAGYLYISGGQERPPLPVTYTTEVVLDNEGTGQNVTFLLTWRTSGNDEKHSWQIHVGADRQAAFIHEEGGTLPSTGCGDRCS